MHVLLHVIDVLFNDWITVTITVKMNLPLRYNKGFRLVKNYNCAEPEHL